MRSARLICCASIVAIIASAQSLTAQSIVTKEDIAAHPYQLPHGDRPTTQRIARHAELAAIAERDGDPVNATRHLALQCYMTSSLKRDPSLSAAPCDRARALAEQHNIADAKVYLKLARGMIEVWSFNFLAGVATLRDTIKQAEGLNPDLPDNLPVVLLHYFLGGTSLEMGQFDVASKELTYTRDHCRTSGNAECAAGADMWLCRMHTLLGDLESARGACDAAAVEAAVHNDIGTLGNLAWMRGFLEFTLGRPQQALKDLEIAWQATATEGTQNVRPIVMQLMTDSLFVLGRLDEVEQWQQRLDAGLKDGSIPPFFGPQIAYRRGRLAAARLKMNDAEAAFMIASRSLIQEMSIRALIAAARVNRVRGNNVAARGLLEQAIKKVENARTTLGGSALRANYLTFHANAYRELAGVHFAADGDKAGAAVLEVAEAGRARALIDALASAQAVGATAQTLTAVEVQAMLRPEDVLVEYVSSEDRLIAVTVTRDRISIANLTGAAMQSQLSRRVDFFAALVQESDEAALKPAAKRLYDDLLAPALQGVPSTARTLIVAADGPLHGLPFDAIGDPPVIDRWNVVMVPSASVLATRARRERPTDAALVVAATSSVPGLAPLTAAPIEADAVRGRVGGRVAELRGDGATESRLAAEHPDRFAILHFASHALVDEERPLRSALILGSESGTNDGRWSAEEIYRSKLRADLVVLSACSTAAGAQTAGEGVMSLSRAFLYAGAGATIATLWDVPDAPGPVFADVLYRGLAAGQPLGVAAADARRELRRLGAPPRAWAAYVLTGNPATRVGITPRTPLRTVAASAIAALAVLGLLATITLAMRQPRSGQLRWAPVATVSVLLAAAAITLQWLPEPVSYADEESLVSRGTGERGIVPFVASNRVVSWPSVKAADEHVVELFNDAGVPIGSAKAETAPYTLPASPGATWFRIGARHDGRVLARSALLRIPN